MTKTAAASNLPEAVLNLSEKIAAGLKVKDNAIEVDENTYVQTLPAELSIETVRAVQEHNAQFYPAATHAVGKLALGILKKDKEAAKVQASIPLYGKDRFDVSIERRRESPNPQNKDQPIVTWGAVSAKVVTHAARTSIGAMNKVRSELSEAALKQFGG